MRIGPVLSTVAVVLMTTTTAAAQIWREPYRLSIPYGVLDQPDSPVEVAPGTIGTQLTSAGISMRRRAPFSTFDGLGDITVRVAAGPFANGMVTLRLRAQSLDHVRRYPSASNVWRELFFARLPEDPRPELPAIGRDHKVYVAVEEVTDTSGAVLFSAPDAREHLWEALHGRARPR